MVQALGQGSREARPGQRFLVSAGHGGRAGMHELPEATSPPVGGERLQSPAEITVTPV